MDTFADRFFHKRSSQEMIQANAAADAAKMEQLQRQVDEYYDLLQNMRKVNLKAAENMEKMQNVLQESFEKISALRDQESLLPDIKRQIDELAKQGNNTQAEREAILSELKTQIEEFVPQIRTQVEEIMPQIKTQVDELAPQIKEQVDELVPQIKTQLDESFKQSDDFLHRENVKVYRNVQASVIDELNKQTDTLTRNQEEGFKKQKAVLPISIIIMLLVLADIFINLFNIIIKF
ncbi:MAG: hypothetical protein J1D87_03600 [Lachnospiraceae bacterium]|nr:hypothetical protein [Lachnospiraceae bacterium]